MNNPAAFGPRGTFAMIAAGFVSFIILLMWMGTGTPQGNNGGAHGLGKGISGYAALVAMLNADGHPVEFNRMPGQIGGPEVRVLTPLAETDTKELARQLQMRRAGVGPTILITPKWLTGPLANDPRIPPDARRRAWARVFGAPAAPAGWTTIWGAQAPNWKGVLDNVSVHLGYAKAPAAHGWRSADGASGPLPDDRIVLSGGGMDDNEHPLIPLVRSGDGRILAGYFPDGGAYPALDAMAGVAPTGSDTSIQPLVVVFEPDLLNNRGMANQATALLARRLVLASMGNTRRQILFDVSLAGLGASKNLLTLAFTPPFLAATICLILAMAGSIWRGFARFGPARAGAPADRVGRIALVEGGAALLLRARRYHLIAAPYAIAARERLIVALSLPRRNSADETDAAIERVQRAVAPGTTPFGEVAARLAGAQAPGAITAQAAELHNIETALGHINRKPDRP
ncbi:hypothetical protein [Novosphingobium sp.]|uniref:hypothetical protein n=1 Tax=Novosphingobium sp. TaxID=1874826 RepID=UPI003B51C975